MVEEFILRDDFIKLGQLLKAAGLVDSGVEAKAVIVDGQVKVNGTVEIQRGKKIHGGDLVEYNGNTTLWKQCPGQDQYSGGHLCMCYDKVPPWEQG